MNNWDMDGFGRDVRHTIQDAINTGDFSRLSRNINDTVSKVFGMNSDDIDIKLSPEGRGEKYQGTNGYGTNYQPNGSRTNYKASGYGTSYQTSGYGTNQRARDNHSGTGRPNRPTAGARSMRGQYPNGKTRVPLVYTPVNGKNALSIVAMIAGYGIAGVLLSASAITGFSASVIGGAMATLTTSTLLVISAPFFALGIFGTFFYKKCSRFKKYINIIGNREVCNISELANGTGKKDKAIVKDLTKMIDKGWFCQGHLDQTCKSLLLTDEAYHEYQQIMAQRTEHEKQQESERTRYDRLDPEIRELIKQGEEYIRIIRRVNDEVPGEEVSNKMYKMEDLVRRIFKRVEEKPEQAGDLKRLMNYYLPTSIKLLEAYAEMDRQEVQGENIINSKREIEETLDTLNVAYEKFLDDMFREAAWDVSSDVSVLKTMLAREGLTENEFNRDKK